jgi:hypothetical protein
MIEIQDVGIRNVKELDGICDYDSDDTLRAICFTMREKWERIVRIQFHTVIFTGVVDEGYAEELYDCIKKYKLGPVIRSSIRVNPNSGHDLRTYIWHLDKKRLSRWFKKNRRKEEEDNA